MADDVAVRQLDAPDRAPGLPPALDGRAGVEQPLTVDALGVDGLVAVAEHHQSSVGEPSPQPTLPAGTRAGVVHHPDVHAGQQQLEPVGERTDERGVVVPQHGVDGAPGPERVEQVARHHVTGVEHHVGVVHVVPHVGRELREVVAEVGVGEDEDT